MSYDPFKHHRRSIRLRGYDYMQAGAYFVTVCEVNRECIFGDVVNGEMRTNQFGEVVLKWWNELPNYYPPVELDEFVAMPNHMHGVIVITDVGHPALIMGGKTPPLPKNGYWVNWLVISNSKSPKRSTRFVMRDTPRFCNAIITNTSSATNANGTRLQNTSATIL